MDTKPDVLPTGGPGAELRRIVARILGCDEWDIMPTREPAQVRQSAR